MHFDLAELSLGWRDGLLFLVVVLAAYMLLELLRIRRLRRRQEKSLTAWGGKPAHSAAAAAPAPPPEPPSVADDMAWNEPPAPQMPEAFARGVESDLAQMREELDALRGEFAALREELRHEAAHMKASQTISPLYSDAMQMAMNGYSAEVIAERCGIARAEAELVAALVKNQE